MIIIQNWRRKWQPTPVFLLRESHGHGNLVGYSPRGGKESDTTKVTKHAWFIIDLQGDPQCVTFLTIFPASCMNIYGIFIRKKYREWDANPALQHLGQFVLHEKLRDAQPGSDKLSFQFHLPASLTWKKVLRKETGYYPHASPPSVGVRPPHSPS